MPGKKLIIISHDAMVYEDLAYLEKLPVFGGLIRRGALVKTLRSIYPTVTYPVHASIITGTYPERHGIVNNEIFNPGELSSPWYWFADAVKTETLFSAAKRKGLKTAAIFWPVTGNHPDIDYLIDEYWSQPGDNDLEAVFARSGSSPEIMDKVIRKNLHLLKGFERKHPQADEFVTACTCDIIREFSPDVLAVHPAAIDGARHASGVFSEIVDKSLEDTERWTGMIIDAVRDTGMLDDTDFVIMSDHGQLETKRIIHLNVILQENGLIDTNEDGSFRDWDAFCKSAGHCVQVYLKNREDRSVYKKTYDLLNHMKNEGIYGFSEVFTEEEIRKKEHLGGDFAFVLESDGYTAFGNDWRRPLVRPHNLNDYKFGRATHGYLPDKGPQPTLIAAGPSFRKGVAIDRRPIVDVAPTLAAVIRAEMNDTDGAVINEMLG